MSLLFGFIFKPLLGSLDLLPQIVVDALYLAPLVICLFVPLSAQLLTG